MDDMGACRPNDNRDKDLGAVLPFLAASDAGFGIRGAEEGPSQQREGRKDESDGCCIVHASL
jgi:hypothetical protein